MGNFFDGVFSELVFSETPLLMTRHAEQAVIDLEAPSLPGSSAVIEAGRNPTQW